MTWSDYSQSDQFNSVFMLMKPCIGKLGLARDPATLLGGQLGSLTAMKGATSCTNPWEDARNL